MAGKIPIIDFNGYGLDVKDATSVKRETIGAIANEIKDALQKLGFCYLKNHGVNQDLVDEYRTVSRNFFEQPVEEKQKFARGDVNFGWLNIGRETVNPERPYDLKEAFNYCPQYDPGTWHNQQHLWEVKQKIFAETAELARRFCDVVSLSLGLDVNFMRTCHSLIGQKNNESIMRVVYYPPLDRDIEVKTNQIRFGEHVDFGTLTFLFLDEVSGLEVEIPGIGYVPVDRTPGTILVNTGQVLQRLTADRILGNKHRVVIPEEDAQKKVPRVTFGFFLHPDDDGEIRCIDGSDTYPPMSAKALVNYQFEQCLNQNRMGD